ncbi:DUF1445 domain-containing protein [Alkalihalophilus pseudofirmus]|nr:DUF1445 domain-containing protein [Alkalihalophilus pseudofirmus]
MKSKLVREKIRSGEFQTNTSGACDEYVQANVVILPKEYAFDFFLYTYRNSQACPVIDVLEAGEYESRLAKGSDIRTDVPLYHIYKNGELHEKRNDLLDLWKNDFVTFLLGCSFTFESQLLENGIFLRHVECKKNVAMYKTNIPTVQAGEFSGPLVVSMRPISNEHIDKVVEITSRYPNFHGAPVHIGEPSEIGIKQIEHPDYGEFVEIKENETPVFWACGVTPQAAAVQAKIPQMITHAPGHMFITDWTNKDFIK